ncbi:MAG: aldose 1-epimerase family protein, partial [Flavitalea sp.]
MYNIQNDLLKASFNAMGAELTSLYSKQYDLDYLWNGDPAFWGKHSPVLFPLVGGLKENTYYLDEKAYTLSRHGFAREKDFSVSSSSAESISFVLKSDASSLLSY